MKHEKSHTVELLPKSFFLVLDGLQNTKNLLVFTFFCRSLSGENPIPKGQTGRKFSNLISMNICSHWQISPSTPILVTTGTKNEAVTTHYHQGRKCECAF